MSEAFSRRIDGVWRLLYWPVLVLGCVDALLATVATIRPLAPNLLIWAIAPTASLAAFTFCLVMVDAETQRAMKRVNIMIGGRPPMLDPDWGLFGSKYPDRPLLLINRFHMAAFGLLALLMRVRPPEPLYLVIAAYFMTTLMAFPSLKRVPAAEAP